jgi:hypothetical protein
MVLWGSDSSSIIDGWGEFMFGMAVDYFVLVSAGFFGIIQIVAGSNSLRGLRIFSGRKLSYFFGTVVTAAAFFWFFATGSRNIEGHITGVQGAEQFELFLAGTLSSLFFTALLVSLLNLKSRPEDQSRELGMEKIRSITYLQAFLRYFKRN